MMNEQQGYLGELPVLPQVEDDIDDYAFADATYIGKVRQTDMPVPLAMAAVGQESYIDYSNSSRQMGFVMGSPDMPGVVMDTNGDGGFAGFADEYEGATGAAADLSIQSRVNFYADKYGIDRNVAQALINQESGYNPKAKSKAGAMGLGQLMPATAKSLGVTDAFDVEQNLDASMKYLRSNLDMFDDYSLALGAYNAGPGSISKYGGLPPYAETQKYVKNIMGRAGMTKEDKGYALNYSFSDNKIKFLDADTGMLSLKGLNDFVYLMKSPMFKDKVKYISTNRPELLSNDSKYNDYAKYRNIKAADGKPLFRKAESNFKGFKVHVPVDTAIAAGALNKNAKQAIAENVDRSQSDMLPKSSQEQIGALLEAFGDRKTNVVSYSKTFGLANLTAKEYNDYGVPKEVLGNPVMQARVLNQEFQRAMDILGSERKAVYALAGGPLRASGDVKAKTWAEIKQDRENFTKNWFITPSEDAAQRDQVNLLVAKYNAESRRLRGE